MIWHHCHFKDWCSAMKADTFNKLWEFIVLEPLKNALPERITLKATELANFVLTHKGSFSETCRHALGVIGKNSGDNYVDLLCGASPGSLRKLALRGGLSV